jgi:hypothetical protein
VLLALITRAQPALGLRVQHFVILTSQVVIGLEPRLHLILAPGLKALSRGLKPLPQVFLERCGPLTWGFKPLFWRTRHASVCGGSRDKT